MQKQLELSLSLAIDWLKFAEGKNATLVAVNGAAIFGILSLLESFPSLELEYVIYVYQTLFFLLLSVVFCLLSFVPQVDMRWLPLKKTPQEGGNLFAYADIANYSPELYLEFMYKKEGSCLENSTYLERDLSELIVVYSGIALRKYALFNIGVWCSLSAIVTPVIGVSVYLARKRGATLST